MKQDNPELRAKERGSSSCAGGWRPSPDAPHATTWTLPRDDCGFDVRTDGRPARKLAVRAALAARGSGRGACPVRPVRGRARHGCRRRRRSRTSRAPTRHARALDGRVHRGAHAGCRPRFPGPDRPAQHLLPHVSPRRHGRRAALAPPAPSRRLPHRSHHIGARERTCPRRLPRLPDRPTAAERDRDHRHRLGRPHRPQLGPRQLALQPLRRGPQHAFRLRARCGAACLATAADSFRLRRPSIPPSSCSSSSRPATTSSSTRSPAPS